MRTPKPAPFDEARAKGCGTQEVLSALRVSHPPNLAEPQKEQQMTQEIAFRAFRAMQRRILRQSQVRRTFLSAFQAGSALVRSLFASLTLLVVATAVPVATAQKIQLSVDVSKPGAKIAPQSFRPIRRTPRPRCLRRNLGRPGLENSEHARDPQRCRRCAQSDKRAERPLARRAALQTNIIGAKASVSSERSHSILTGAA